MQNTFLPALPLALLIFALSCSDCDKEDEIVPLPEFTGFSLTDENGQAMSDPDLTDWRVNDEWIQQEKDLFDFPELPICSHNASALPAYPNPCGNVLNFYFISTESATGYFRVVDKDFNILADIDSVPFEAGGKIVALNFSAITADTVRLYYRIVDGTCEYRGHGDVLVQ